MRKSTFFRLCVIILVLAGTNAAAQSLSRRVFLGIRMEELTDDVRNILGIGAGEGILISDTVSQSTAAAAGFRKGDVLLQINDSSFGTTSEIIAYLARQHAADSFRYVLLRDKMKISGKAQYKAMPEEHYPGIRMIYTDAEARWGRQRMIISKPEQFRNRLPVILFIGGVGCYSLDFPFDSSRSEVRFLNTVTRSGFLCARAEKPGMGDNAGTGKSCSEVSFMEEMEGYLQMVRELKLRPDVDSNSVYIFGHSMGGVFAPLIARRTELKGIIAYGTIGSNFLEYLVKTRKTIAEAYDMDPVESDNLVKDYCECAVYYFAGKMSSAETEKAKPGCAALVAIFDLRSRAYNDELYALNIPSLWREFNGQALLLWGTSDYISSEDDHRMVAAAINHYHPGHAEFIAVKDTDHPMLHASDFKASKNHPGGYNSAVDKIVVGWLKKQS